MAGYAVARLRGYAAKPHRATAQPRNHSSRQTHIRSEPMHPTLASETRFLVPPERRGGIELVVRIRPDHAGAELRGHLQNARAFLRPHTRRQSIRRVVRLLDRFLGRAEREHREDGAEDLFLGDAVGLRDAGEEGRREPEAARGQLARGLHHLRAFLDAALDELADLLELRARVDRADVGVLVERIADAQRLDALAQLADHRLDDRFLHEEPRARAADVALVEVDAVDDALDRLVDRRVLEHDVRRLAAQLQGQLLLRARDRALDAFADFGRAGER